MGDQEPVQGSRRRVLGAAEWRELGGLFVGLVGAAGVLFVLCATAVSGEWGRVAVAVGAIVLLLVGRGLARYDPVRAEIRRAQRRELAAIEAQGLTRVGVEG